MRRLILLLLIISGGYLASAQDEEMVLYTPDFRFKDGIYLNFDQVKINSPIPKAKIVTSADYNSRDFFAQIFESESLYFYDAMGIRQELDKNSIWGYSRNGILYIQEQGEFQRITFVGSLCHFVADITTQDRRYYNDPYSNRYNPYSYSANSYYNSYSPYGYSPYMPVTTSRNELRQYVIEFESGRKVEYEVRNVEVLLMKDPEIYDEFVRLSRKKKKQMLFYYIRKFNEKHPLYIPKN
ncbi:MAG: hypothetical protein QNK33_04365 [Bacteroidales bacterium]|nr:hypothetical protein [Bacteroidales bacterium]